MILDDFDYCVNCDGYYGELSTLFACVDPYYLDIFSEYHNLEELDANIEDGIGDALLRWLEDSTYVSGLLTYLDDAAISILLDTFKGPILPSKEDLYHISDFLESGLLFCYEEEGNYYLFVPEDTVTMLLSLDYDEIRKQRDDKQELFHFAKAAAHLYGSISYDELVEIHQYYGTTPSITTEIFEDIMTFFVGKKDSISLDLMDYVTASSLMETADDLILLQKKYDHTVRYYPETYTNFLKFADPNHRLLHPETGTMAEYFANKTT